MLGGFLLVSNGADAAAGGINPNMRKDKAKSCLVFKVREARHVQ